MPETMLKVVDEKISGKSLNEITIPFQKSTVTVKEIIASRVALEVQKYNEELTGYFDGFIRPAEAEETLNGYKMKSRKQIDVEKQVYVALHAFQHNGYFVFVDERQVESLDEEIHITSDTKVSFIKLTQLVGG